MMPPLLPDGNGCAAPLTPSSRRLQCSLLHPAPPPPPRRSLLCESPDAASASPSRRSHRADERHRVERSDWELLLQRGRPHRRSLRWLHRLSGRGQPLPLLKGNRRLHVDRGMNPLFPTPLATFSGLWSFSVPRARALALRACGGDCARVGTRCVMPILDLRIMQQANNAIRNSMLPMFIFLR
jgi:hypothetical protein